MKYGKLFSFFRRLNNITQEFSSNKVSNLTRAELFYFIKTLKENNYEGIPNDYIKLTNSELKTVVYNALKGLYEKNSSVTIQNRENITNEDLVKTFTREEILDILTDAFNHGNSLVPVNYKALPIKELRWITWLVMEFPEAPKRPTFINVDLSIGEPPKTK